MHPRLALSLLILTLPLAARAADVYPQVVNGLGELGEPATVGLVQGTVPLDGALVCSGVLIGCDSVLTSAHCFNAYASLKTHIYLAHAGFLPIESATQHPAYVDALVNRPPGWIDTTREDDIAFVKLAENVIGVTPATLFDAPAPGPGTPGFVVGFGRDPVSEAEVANPGLKRSGAMVLDDCEDPALAGLDLLCWGPSEPLPEPGNEVSTCTGDSGGPLYTHYLGVRRLSGITKGAILDPQGQPDTCLPPVHPYDVNVQRHLSWIGGADGFGGMVAATGAVPLALRHCSPTPQLPEQASGAAPCDATPLVPGEPGRTCGFEGALGGVGPTGVDYAFPVPVGTGTLRVALNGFASTAGGLDTDLYVRRGAPATPALHDCGADGAGTLGFCEWTGPQPGTWYARVEQPLAEGDHQVVVTLLAPASPAVFGVRSAAAAALAALLALTARAALRQRSRA